jgi:hypothetical protein
MKIIECVQGTGEWWEAKRGIPSASNFDRILTAVSAKPSAQAEDYICELVADMASLNPPYFTNQGKPINAAMQHGINTEPEARRWYELQRNVDVRKVGFCVSDDERIGCSPDGLLGEDAGIEIKCPELKTQAKYLLNGTLPNEYKCQVHGSLIVTGRAYWEFLSYAPGLPPFLIRVEPDPFTAKLKAALAEFLVQFTEALAKFNIKPRWQS